MSRPALRVISRTNGRPRLRLVDDIDKLVGLRIRSARLAANLTQEALGKTCEVTYAQIHNYERGDDRCSPHRLSKIARATGRPISYFFPDPETAAPAGVSPSDRVLADPEGRILVSCYDRISDPAQRAALVRIAETLANCSPVEEPR